MRTLLIAIAALSLSFVTGDKDKYDVKDNVATLNGNPIFRMDYKDKWSEDFKLQTLDGKNVAFFKFESFNDKNAAETGNPEGRVIYYDILFFESGQKCEMSARFTKKNLVKELHYHKLVSGNEINEDNIKSFILIHGTKFSEQRKTSPTIIINK